MDNLITLRLEKPIHGGYCMGRHEGRVILVRHGAPGELVTVELTDTGKTWRGNVVDVHQAHPDRVEVPWTEAGPGGVGAELAHLRLPAQRQWKQDVIDDALRRIGGLSLPITVNPVDDTDGWGSRTRIELTTDDQGRAGMHKYRTNTHVPLTRMPLAHPDIQALDLFDEQWPANSRLTAVAPSADGPVVLVGGRAPRGHPGTVWERVDEYEYLIDAAGFWQAHTRAPKVLKDAVMDAVGDITGATVFDLFSGAGLFTLPLADVVGPTGTVHAVEGDHRAVRRAAENAAERTNTIVHHGDVPKVLGGEDLPGSADVIVLDPPRVGARQKVVEAMIARGPRRIVYVSCDPAALARDLKYAKGEGYEAKEIVSYDLFPHTHHIESLAVLEPVP